MTKGKKPYWKTTHCPVCASKPGERCYYTSGLRKGGVMRVSHLERCGRPRAQRPA